MILLISIQPKLNESIAVPRNFSDYTFFWNNVRISQRRKHMQYADIIAREADSLPLEKQAEVLDFIAFLKDRQNREKNPSIPRTPEEIEGGFP